jgi:RimJ/RimL family protein N-acetyltransferase
MLMLRTDGAPKLIGSCGLGERDGEAELGYWIARPYWGQGFAAEAARAVVNIAKALGHEKLVSGHFTDNPASGRVLRKIGFQPLGRIEQRYSAGRGREVSCALYDKPLVAKKADGTHAPPAVAMNRMRPTPQMMQAA